MTSFRLRNGGDETEGAGEGVGKRKGREGRGDKRRELMPVCVEF